MSENIKSISDFKKNQTLHAQYFGELFEKMFINMAKVNGLAVTRIPDGCKQLAHNKIIRVKSPFDYVISYRGLTALVDTKTSNSEVFAHSAITQHQVDSMAHHNLQGIKAGYVIWLRKNNRVIFVPALELIKLSKSVGSIKSNQLGVIQIGNGAFFDPRYIFGTLGGSTLGA